MHNHFIRALAPIAFAGAIAGWSQTTSAPNAPVARPRRMPAPMLPFTAEFKTTRVQTLANGATITTESTSAQARDGQGRYYESNIGNFYAGGTQVTLSHITDPVAGTETRWDSRVKKATVFELPPQDQRHGCWQSEAGTNRWSYPLTPEQRAEENAAPVKEPVTLRPQNHHPVTEQLGTDVILGLTVRGTRTTFTTPVGEIGNDQPLVQISENWSSDEYRLNVRSVTDDPREGKTTRELTSFTPGEPDPAQFQPPQGYEVVTEQLHQIACHQ
jgi:hypothetical protein